MLSNLVTWSAWLGLGLGSFPPWAHIARNWVKPCPLLFSLITKSIRRFLVAPVPHFIALSFASHRKLTLSHTLSFDLPLFCRPHFRRLAVSACSAEHLWHLEDCAATHTQGTLSISTGAHAHHHIWRTHHALWTSTALGNILGCVACQQCTGYAQQALRQRHQWTLWPAVLKQEAGTELERSSHG